MQLLKTIKAIGKLSGWMIFFYLFSVYGLKYITHTNLFMPVQKVIEEQSIDPSVFFYSDQLFMDSVSKDVTLRHLTLEK